MEPVSSGPGPWSTLKPLTGAACRAFVNFRPHPTDTFPMDLGGMFSSIDDLLSYSLYSFSEGKDLSIKSILLVIALIWCFSRIADWVERLAQTLLYNKDIDPGVKGSIERFSRYFVIVLGFFISLGTLGLNLNSVTTIAAVVGVGLGLGLQNITQNFMSGIIILLERPIKKGDIVQVGQTSGRVLDIRARSTLVLTRDDVVIIVPNSQFMLDQVVNDSFSGDKLRLCVDVGVAYDSDLERVSQILLAIAESHPRVLTSPPSTVVVKGFADFRIELGLRIWTDELWFSDVILSDIRLQIVQDFKKHGIVIPYPQRDIHLFQGDPQQDLTTVPKNKAS